MTYFKPIRYIPPNAVKVSDKKSDAVAYVYESAGNPCARIFYGKQTKPVGAFRFRDAAERSKTILRYFESRQASCTSKAGYRAEQKAWIPTYKIGDIFNTCWGYDQTNMEYFEVTEVKGKHLILCQIAVKSYATGHMSNKVIPLPGEFIGKPIRKLAQQRGVRIDECRWASLTTFAEPVKGVKIYQSGDTSSYA